MRGGRHNSTIFVVVVALAATFVAVLVVPGRSALDPSPTEVSTAALTGTPVVLAATRGVPVRAPIALFTDPERGLTRDAMGFVEVAFRDLLDRPPGPTTLAQWTGRLDDGGPRTALTTMLTTSGEYRRRTVEQLYRAYLQREPTGAEIASWAARLGQGQSTVWLRTQLLGSGEYFTRRAGRDIQKFLIAVYGDVLGRPPDGTAARSWAARLAAGSTDRAGVAAFLLASGEGRRHIVSQAYEALLGRTAAAAEAQHWATLLGWGLPEEDVTAAVTASAEYFERLPNEYAAAVDWGDGSRGAASMRRVGADGIEIAAAHPFAAPGTFAVTVTLTKQDGGSATATSTVTVEAPSNERFVDSLYRDVLGRPADPGGLAAFTRALTAGGEGSRRSTVLWILTTAERRQLVVRELFKQYLDRTPSTSAAAGWVAALAVHPVDWLRAQLLGSGEYFRSQAGGTATGFVDAVFRDVLGRAPDAANRRSLTAMLAGGATRVEIAERLLSTSEARRRLVSARYGTLLDRPPRTDEMRHWVTSLARGTSEHQLMATLLGSSEYFARFPPAGSGSDTSP